MCLTCLIFEQVGMRMYLARARIWRSTSCAVATLGFPIISLKARWRRVMKSGLMEEREKRRQIVIWALLVNEGDALKRQQNIWENFTS